MTDNMIRPRMGRPSITGEPRTTRWPLTLALSEIARLDALPGGSNPAKIMGALDDRDVAIAALDEIRCMGAGPASDVARRALNVILGSVEAVDMTEADHAST